MNRQTKQFGVTMCLMAMAFFAAWPFWKWVYMKSVSPKLHDRTQALVDKNPQLKTAWEVAIQDGVLTYPEAKVIIEAAGEKADPE